MLSCKELVANSSDFLDGQLRLRQRIAVRLHLASCSNCRRFIRQMRVTQAVLRTLPETPIPELDSLAKRLAEMHRG
ncbi:putative anti-sigma-YlaC factor YlaD [Pseudomonas sp. TE3786]